MIHLPNGPEMDLFKPDPTQFEWHHFYGVVNQRRYAGRVDVTVGQHCLLGALLAYRAGLRGCVALALACHDLHEGIIGDAWPIKKAIPQLEGLDHIWEQAVFAWAGIDLDEREERAFRDLDNRLVLIECQGYGASAIAQRQRDLFDLRPVTGPEAALCRAVSALRPHAVWDALMGLVGT